MNNNSYDHIFPEALAFEEIKSKLFKTLIQYKCAWCKDLTYFLDYNFNDQPLPICSEGCYYNLLNLKKGLLLE